MARFNRSKEDWSQSSLEIYLREINKTPLLTAEQEKQLAYRILETGDPEARDQMARANLRLGLRSKTTNLGSFCFGSA